MQKCKWLYLKDRSGKRETVVGRSLDNMIRRQWGNRVYGLNVREGEPFTVVRVKDGAVLGSAIYYTVD